MLTRDRYVALLQKRASEDADGAKNAISDYKANLTSNRAELEKNFSGAGEVEKADSRLVGKLFPGDSKKESGNPLMKVARVLFYDATSRTPMLKTASAAYREVALRSFVNELEKIAAFTPALHTALDAARKAPKTVGGSAQKFMGQHMKAQMPKPPAQMAQGSVAQAMPTARTPSLKPQLPGIR